MIGRIVALFALLMPFAATAQAPKELLLEVPPSYAARLQEYNSAYIQKAAFNAFRYRIARVNINALLQDRDITITPFEDVIPIELTRDELQFGSEETNRQKDEFIRWHGHIQNNQEELGETAPEVDIIIMSWDVDSDGNASPSPSNRFEYSPVWDIDENDQPVLQKGVGTTLAPPPNTPEAIARHKKLKALKQRQFQSASALIESDTATYQILPLTGTPKYSLVLEMKPFGNISPPSIEDNVVPERYPGETKAYLRLLESLSPEPTAVLEDLR